MTLEDYAKLIVGQTCRWCGTTLPAEKIEHYTHPDGWLVSGFEMPQWLFVHCPKCGYDHALWKLGVPREQEAR